MSSTPWQVILFRTSLMKKEKVSLVKRWVDFSGKLVFDLGCSQGVVSYQLKQSAGRWVHADLDMENLQTCLPLLGGSLFQLSEDTLPLKPASFDCVLALDILEHVSDSDRMIEEINRILKPGGQLIVSTPISGGRYLLNSLKEKVGLTADVYGHKREGFSLAELTGKIENRGFQVKRATTYAKFLVEFFEVLVNIFFVRKKRKQRSSLRSGSISPSSAAELDRNRGLFSIYRIFVYPLIWLLTRLDRLLWFKTGYATLVIAEKR